MTGHYDILPQPKAVSNDYDYICVIDKVEKENDGVWRFVQNPYYNSDLKRMSVWARMHPHILFPNYDFSLYIDANVQICSLDFYRYLEQVVNECALIAQVPHPTRDCIYDELEQCLNVRKVTPWQYIRHRNSYTKNGLPKHWGLYEDNIIFRTHNNQKVIRISELWWSEYLKISNRDQLCLMLVYWKCQYKPVLLLGDGQNARNSSLIRCFSHSCALSRNSVFSLTRIRHFIERKTLLPVYRFFAGAEDYHSQW